jgi:rod shape-determining protein MreD
MRANYIYVAIGTMLVLFYGMLPISAYPFLSFDLVVLMLVYWVIFLKFERVMVLAWGIGLLLDVIQSTLLGEHAFSLCLVAFLAIKLSCRFCFFSLLQQGVCVGALVLLNHLLLTLFEALQGNFTSASVVIYPGLMSAFLWSLLGLWGSRLDNSPVVIK